MKEKYKLFLLAIESYNMGDSIISDHDFDNLWEELKQAGILGNEHWSHYLSEKQEDEGIDKFSELKSFSAKSIKTIKSIDEAYAWIKSLPAKTRLSLTLKIDGINIRMEVRNGKLTMAITKGTSGNSLNVSRAIRTALDLDNNPIPDGFYRLESVVLNRDFEAINEYSEYKKHRGAAMGIMTNKIPEYDRLSVFLLATDRYVDLEEMYKSFEGKTKMKIPPHISVLVEEITNREHLENLFSTLNKLQKELGVTADGVVIKVSDSIEFESMDGDDYYDNGNIAVKASYWATSNNLKSKVIDIEFNKVGDNGGAKLIIEPVSAEGSKITQVNAYNPMNVIRQNIRIGDIISFNYVGNSSIELVGLLEEGPEHDDKYDQDEIEHTEFFSNNH